MATGRWLKWCVDGTTVTAGPYTDDEMADRIVASVYRDGGTVIYDTTEDPAAQNQPPEERTD